MPPSKRRRIEEESVAGQVVPSEESVTLKSDEGEDSSSSESESSGDDSESGISESRAKPRISDDVDEASESDDEAPLPITQIPSSSRLSIRPRATAVPPKEPPADPTGSEDAPKIPVSKRPTISDFPSLGVSAAITASLNAMSIKRPTPVQAACIPSLLEGNDCVGNAKTGQGKTVAFAVPIIQQLSKDPFGIFALVLTPTRELAFQISQQFAVIGAPLDVKTTVVVGGMDMMSQMIALNSRPHVVVATPGRLVDLLNESSGEWSLDRIKFLVLDEADRLLGTAFASDLAAIFAKLPTQRQTCLFTATLTPNIEALALAPPRQGKSKPFVYRDSDSSTIETVESLKQQYILCPSHVREVYLYHLLCNPPESILHLRRGPASQERKKKNKSRRLKNHEIGFIRKDGKKQKVKDDDFTPDQPPPTIIFVQTSHSAAYLEIVLKELGFRSTSLHSKLSQQQRLASLSLFRGFIVPILICTDVGARGLDMDGVGLVINWDLPRNPKETEANKGDLFQTAEETYLHRVGRTARMGRGGMAISFVTERIWDEVTLRRIEDKINTKLTEMAMKEDVVLEKLNLVSAAKRLASMELEHSDFGKKQERYKAVKRRKERNDGASEGT